MKLKFAVFILSALSACLLSGCITQAGGLSASTVPITSKDSYTVIKKGVRGSDSAISLVFIPLSTCSPYKALQNAKKENDADALINVTAENKSLYLLIVNWQWVRVYGDAIKFQRSGAVVEK